MCKIKPIISFLTILTSSLIAQDYGTWSPVADLNEERYEHASTVLPDGNVLVTGGELVDATLCEIFNVEENTWTYTTPMNRRRYVHSIIKLFDGRVMVIGGIDKSCELYDPINQTWTLTDSIKQERTVTRPTVNLLDDSKVLITGGWVYNKELNVARYLNTCEIYNPQTGKWNFTDSLKTGRDGHSATKLKNGKVLVIGGHNKEHSAIDNALRSCEIFDPVTQQWSLVDSLNYGRSYHSALLLNDGKVFVSGGSNLTECELYEPELDRWTTIGSSAGSYDKSILLNDTTAMLLHSSAEWELFDVKNFKSIHIGSNSGIYYSEILKLNNGKIISIGGLTSKGTLIERSKKCMLYTQGVTRIKENNLQSNFELKQNYPNPFNPSTSINYYLPSSGFITLKVYDLLGEEVIEIDKGYKRQGHHKVEFNASNLTSGVYIYKLTAGKHTASKKMLVVK